MQRLLERLIEIQQETGLSDADFAKQKLGVSRQQWQFNKAGTRNIGGRTLNGILWNMPELAPEILVYLRKKNGE